MKALDDVIISLDSVQPGLFLEIAVNQQGTLFDSENDVSDSNEARFQLVEGCTYDFRFSSVSFTLNDSDKRIVKNHQKMPSIGNISPGIYVGTLSLQVVSIVDKKEVFQIQLEVQSAKTDYRRDYRDMLEFITEKSTELLMQADSPASHYFEIDYSKNHETLYQKFSFLKSIIQTDEFAEAVHRVVSAPVTKWTEIEDKKDTRQERKFSGSILKQFGKIANRTVLPANHNLRKVGLESLPQRIVSFRKDDSVDTPENRFIKHVLDVFLKFSNDIHENSKKHIRLHKESGMLSWELENYLHHSVFKRISRPTLLKLNSPVLQRKEGYREILKVWLMFDLASRLIWKGGDDVYSAGKKNIATLYEYWLFFQLLELFKSMFSLNSEDLSKLIVKTDDGLNLSLKAGKQTALKGIYSSGTRNLNIRFNYNRVFSGERAYPDSGSWTTNLRPDYTLSIWPSGIDEQEAEKEELIVHIHFDAKYKVTDYLRYFRERSEDELNIEKEEQKTGVFRNADLLKMHAYKDAIRRTGGAYVLYPGDKSDVMKGFHEIIPGLGAFAIKPSKNDTGISDLKDFIHKIISHFINRASQREKIAYRTYDIFKYPPHYELKESLPETYFSNRDLLPDETFVMVGYYKSENHYKWIKEKKKYNFRIGNQPGSIPLNTDTVKSKFILLHGPGDNYSSDLWRIVGNGAKIYSSKDSIFSNYSNQESRIISEKFYLVFDIEKVTDKEFVDVKWKFKELKNYQDRHASAIPFTTSLTELMNCKLKNQL